MYMINNGYITQPENSIHPNMDAFHLPNPYTSHVEHRVGENDELALTIM